VLAGAGDAGWNGGDDGDRLDHDVDRHERDDVDRHEHDDPGRHDARRDRPPGPGQRHDLPLGTATARDSQP
jgi:hypothetical protein